MLTDLVKVTHSRGQTRITIPKMIAEETGLDKAKIVEIELCLNNEVVIKEWDGAKNEKRDIPENKT